MFNKKINEDALLKKPLFLIESPLGSKVWVTDYKIGWANGWMVWFEPGSLRIECTQETSQVFLEKRNQLEIIEFLKKKLV